MKAINLSAAKELSYLISKDFSQGDLTHAWIDWSSSSCISLARPRAYYNVNHVHTFSSNNCRLSCRFSVFTLHIFYVFKKTSKSSFHHDMRHLKWGLCFGWDQGLYQQELLVNNFKKTYLKDIPKEYITSVFFTIQTKGKTMFAQSNKAMNVPAWL